MLSFLLQVFIGGLALFLILIVYFSRQKKNTESSYEVIEGNSSPKISASVSNIFYDEIKTYCQRHHMTMSDLIRKSVQNYMDENK